MRIRHLLRPLACLLVPSFLGAQVLAPVQLVGEQIRSGAEKVGKVTKDAAAAVAQTAGSVVSQVGQAGGMAAREVGEATRQVYFATQGDGATGVARSAKKAVNIAPKLHQATLTSKEQFMLRRAQQQALEGEKILSKIGKVTPGNTLFSGGSRASVTTPVAPAAPTESTAIPSSAPRSTTSKVIQVANGTVTRAPSLARTGLQGLALAKVAAASPVAAQFQAPFQPANVAFAVAATAGFHLFHQLRDDEAGVDLQKVLGFVVDRSFWGGIIGSGLGYSLASVIATALIPVGGGLLATLAPLTISMLGSAIGWQIGSALLSGQGIQAGLEALAPGRLLGQSLGTTVGLLLGANLAGLAVGTMGVTLGAAGAIAGALVLGNMGASIGSSFDESVPTGDPDQIFASIDQAQGNLATLQAGTQMNYDSLRRALAAGDNAAALAELQRLQAAQNALNQALQKATPGQ